MTTTHIRADEALKDWMDKNRKDGDTISDQIKKALIAQTRFDAGARKDPKTIKTSELLDASRRLEELLEL